MELIPGAFVRVTKNVPPKYYKRWEGVIGRILKIDGGYEYPYEVAFTIGAVKYPGAFKEIELEVVNSPIFNRWN